MKDTYGIVLVDEIHESRLRLHREVNAAGVAVVGEANSSQETFTQASAAHADAILISIEEPIARGLRLIEAMAAALPDTPIIAVSTQNNRELMRKVVLAGARDVLSRPVRREELLETLAIVSKQRERQRLGEGNAAQLGQGTIITVFGPKGGVGKTTLAINLGVFIASQNKERVLLVDLDAQVGAAAVMLNLVPKQTVVDLAYNLRHIDRDLVRNFVTTHNSGLDVLPSALWSSGHEDELTPDDLTQLLIKLSSYYDYVIIDTPPQINPVVFRALEMSTYIFLMTSLEVASIQATKRVLDKIVTWEFAKDKIKVVTNVSNGANSLGKADVETALGYPVFWSVPHDVNVAIASQLGQPIVQVKASSKAAQSIQQLRYTLIGAQAPRGNGLGRLLNAWRN